MQSIVFMGTCAQIPYEVMQKDDPLNNLDLQFDLHSHIPASIPILPTDLASLNLADFALDHDSLQYHSMYDGIIIINTMPRVHLT